MAVDQNVDPLAYLEEAMKPTPKATGDFKPFFFKVSDGEKALIRPLLNMLDYVEVYKHEYFDNTSKTWKFRALCVEHGSFADADLVCQTCLDVEAMPETTKEEKAAKRKSRATRRMVLPIYLHTVVNVKTGNPVTYKNQENEDVPVNGPRLLEMKPEYSTILHDLLKAYQHPMGGHDITKYDFKIECSLGSDGFPKYDVTPKSPSDFIVEVPQEWTNKEGVLGLYYDACPPKLVGDDKPEPVAAAPAKSTKGTVKSAPDF